MARVVLAPRIYRRCRYVTVSEATAEELGGLGHRRRPDLGRAQRRRAGAGGRVRAVGGAAPGRARPAGPAQAGRARDRGARPARDRWPGLRLSIVGEGWWEDELRAAADRLGVADRVDFHGFVDEQAKHEELARAWVHLCPSVKEGWGLVVTEAGAHRVPTVGYRSAGGLRESVLDGRTGVLVDDLDEMTEAVDRLLADAPPAATMGEAAARHAAAYSWTASIRGFAGALSAAVRGSGAGAVLEHVDRLLVALVDGVSGDRGLDADDRGDSEHGTDAEREQRSDERLHSVLSSVRDDDGASP